MQAVKAGRRQNRLNSVEEQSQPPDYPVAAVVVVVLFDSQFRSTKSSGWRSWAPAWIESHRPKSHNPLVVFVIMSSHSALCAATLSLPDEPEGLLFLRLCRPVTLARKAGLKRGPNSPRIAPFVPLKHVPGNKLLE